MTLRMNFLIKIAGSNNDQLSTGLSPDVSCILRPCQGLTVTSFQDSAITLPIAAMIKLSCSGSLAIVTSIALAYAKR